VFVSDYEERVVRTDEFFLVVGVKHRISVEKRQKMFAKGSLVRRGELEAELCDFSAETGNFVVDGIE
jgi:hypothetical protein